MEVAAHGGDGERFTTGQKIEQRLFFDGINVFGNQPTVDKTVQDSIPVFPYPANTAFALFYVAMMIAQFTDHLVSLSGSIKHSLFHVYTLNLSFQFAFFEPI